MKLTKDMMLKPLKLRPQGTTRITGMERRLMSKSEAADYCGMCVNTFAEKVKAGLLPSKIPDVNKWDRKALDMKLDELSGIDTQSPLSPLEKWEREHARETQGTA